MEAMSSADFAPKEEEPKTSSADKSPQKYTDALNKFSLSKEDESSSTKKAPSKNTFQQMIADSEMKVSVAKKAPKKGMQLGKPKTKKNALIQELEKQNVIDNDGNNNEGDAPSEEQKQDAQE